MAKQLKKIFTSGSDQIDQTYTVESWHVSQSIDAFTGTDDYDITLSGSFTLTGSLSTTGSVNFSGLTTSSQSNVVVIDSSTGQLYYTASSAFVEFVDTGSFVVTGSISSNVLTFTKGDASTFDLNISPVTSSLITTASVSNNDITFTKGNGDTFIITVDTGSGGTNIYNTNGILTGNRSLDLSNNNLTFDAVHGETFQTVLDVGATHSIKVDEGMIQILPGTGFAEVSSSYLLTYDSSSGRVQYMSTASFSGGSTTPGGSNTQVQFNENGSFGGDANFTWNSGSNYLTLKGDTNAPALKLENSTPGLSDGSEIAELVARSAVYNADIAGIIFKGDGATGGGDYPSRIEFTTTPDGTVTPTTKFQIKNNGQLIADEYGSGSFTGTAAKWLAVSASGEIIEEAAPVGGVNGYTRPGSDTSITYDTYLSSTNYSVNAVGTSPTAPSSNGDVSIRYVTSNIGSNVDRIDVYYTASGGGDNSDTLENLAVSGSITLLQVGGGSHEEVYRIISVTDETTYVSYAVEWESGDDAAISTTTTDTFTFDANYTYELSAGYNRLSVVNNSNATNRLEFAPPSSANAGDEVIVEMNPEPTNTVQPAFIVRDGTPLYKKVERVWEITGGSISQIQATGNDRVMMKFMVTVAGSIKGLMLLGATNYIDN
jgi:hypothetical protein